MPPAAAACASAARRCRKCTAISSSIPATRPGMILKRWAKPFARGSRKSPESSYTGKSSGLESGKPDADYHLMRITIFFGGTNKERLVSVASAQALHRALPEADLWFWHVADTVHEVRSETLLNHKRPF